MARRTHIGLLFAASATAILAGSAQAQAPAPKPKLPAAAPAAAPDPAFEAMRAAFEALPEAERKAIQDALVWSGDYNSVVTGGFGRRTFEALNAFRARAGAQGDVLGPGMRAALLAAGETARKAARFTVKPDPASRAVVGVPEGLLTKRSALPGGTRWQSPDGRVTLESRSFPAGETDLDALFERATAPLNDRKVTYKLKRPDFIVVTAETGSGLSYVRYASGAEGIRGFALGYDRALAAEVDRLAIAIANSFVPFPGAAPAVEAPKVEAKAEAPKGIPKPPAAALKPPLTQAALPPAPGPIAPAGTGLVVAAGRVLTASAVVETCPAPRIGGGAGRVLKSDPARGLALLEAGGLPKPALPGLRTGPIASGDGLVVVAAGAEGVAVAPGSGSGAGGVFAPLQPGAAGAPVLDRAGGLAGLVARFPAAPRLIAGVMPPTSYALVPGGTVAAFLAENGIGSAPPAARGDGTLGTVAAAVGPAVVAITCGR